MFLRAVTTAERNVAMARDIAFARTKSSSVAVGIHALVIDAVVPSSDAGASTATNRVPVGGTKQSIAGSLGDGGFAERFGNFKLVPTFEHPAFGIAYLGKNNRIVVV